MIELLNVNKTYTSNSKIQVKALDQVNLQFNSKGLVFVDGRDAITHQTEEIGSAWSDRASYGEGTMTIVCGSDVLLNG